ncbi:MULTISPECIES: hypothetical protein [Bacillaceae]|uniref:hypothetical protein n=1 Tax=Bacillaceae TaxID=186817 RepID=UPI0006F8613D|nr:MULTISPECIES: hypothetical protein [Bacillaceae]KQL37187.1 hypothetical protein AN959_03920 [Psychrobacillus sp. FJAT-21963]MDF2067598.1 hypothetical protein [Bacillus sp. Cr_A10]
MSNKHETSTTELNENNNTKTYLEILGDTILPNQLLLAILLSVGVSLGGYNIGLWLLPSFASENMVASYSLLIGISGSVISLVICSIIFKPKRLLIEEETSSESMKQVFEDLQLDPIEELNLIENDPVTKKELEELGVLNSFRALGGEQKK